jgi:hypothetical protein
LSQGRGLKYLALARKILTHCSVPGEGSSIGPRIRQWYECEDRSPSKHLRNTSSSSPFRFSSSSRIIENSMSLVGRRWSGVHGPRIGSCPPKSCRMLALRSGGKGDLFGEMVQPTSLPSGFVAPIKRLPAPSNFQVQTDIYWPESYSFWPISSTVLVPTEMSGYFFAPHERHPWTVWKLLGIWLGAHVLWRSVGFRWPRRVIGYVAGQHFWSVCAHSHFRHALNAQGRALLCRLWLYRGKCPGDPAMTVSKL